MNHPVRSSLNYPLFVAILLLLWMPPSSALAQGCDLSGDPPPAAPLVRPSTSFNSDEYSFVHSSTHLQGQPWTEKFAPGLYYQPTDVLSGFSSALVVNNPSPTFSAAVTIQYYDAGGMALTPPSLVTLPPEGSHVESASILATSATPGLGSAMITSDHPIVGATLHHASSIDGCTDPDSGAPGASSMQQLQLDTGASELWWGPIPVSNMSSLDFLNGILPFFSVMNAGSSQTTLTITINRPPAPPFVLSPVVIPSMGTHFETFMWTRLAEHFADGPAPVDHDLWIHVTSNDGAPLIGEGILADPYGGEVPSDTLVACGKMRMTSSMMANRQARFLLNPELLHVASGLIVETIMGVTNVSSADIGPVVIEYFDSSAVLLGADTVASMPAASSLRIGPGLAASPSYPLPGLFAGWVRIRACLPGLIGHTVREVTGTEAEDFQKAYGETLKGGNVQEPGPGFPVEVAGMALIRKVIPFSRVSSSLFTANFWPGYSTFVNPTTSNIGSYFVRFFDLPGVDVTSYAGQPFAGLPWGHTSFSYEDPHTTLMVPTSVSGRVDHTSGRVEGIDVIGDPLAEFFIDGFPAPGLTDE